MELNSVPQGYLLDHVDQHVDEAILPLGLTRLLFFGLLELLLELGDLPNVALLHFCVGVFQLLLLDVDLIELSLEARQLVSEVADVTLQPSIFAFLIEILLLTMGEL